MTQPFVAECLNPPNGIPGKLIEAGLCSNTECSLMSSNAGPLANSAINSRAASSLNDFRRLALLRLQSGSSNELTGSGGVKTTIHKF